ncbi:MAG: isoprenylcysteine carboxylmethyltransferase family protein [Candidatus Caldatribacteriota bacterium]|nr:isoprenylcysteine carboxylmethyltransferase family protein [Candidatus Caldatribacteriota bacterium]
MKKNFYIFPPILVCINFAILLPLGIILIRLELNFWDCISIAVGGILTIIFVVSLVSTHKIEQANMKPNDVNKLLTDGPYSIVRHPNFTGIICMNVAYLFFFRTLWLIPPICVFFVLWYFEAKSEESVLIAKFGEAYKNYMKTTGMFFPKLFKSKT